MQPALRYEHGNATDPWEVAPSLQIFVHNLDATGVVRNALAIAEHFIGRGYRVRLLTCCSEGVLRQQLHPSVELVNLIGSARPRQSRKAQLRHAILAYRRQCVAWRPDILMSAGNHGHLLSCLAWIGLPGIKILRVSNDLTHGKNNILRRAKIELISRLADHLILVSAALAQNPRIAKLMRLGKATIIPNGVDIEAVRTAAAQPCPHSWMSGCSSPVVLAVGRHVPQKNLPMLITAFALARKNSKMRLVILGSDRGEASNQLRELALKLGIASDVHFVGDQPNPFPYMAAASVVVLPSLWEGSSNVLLEAMACGTPVIASRTAGNATEVLAGGKYGVLVDPLDAQDLSAALLKQTGGNPLLPRHRALDFDRRTSLIQYSSLIRKLTITGDSRSATNSELSLPSSDGRQEMI